MPPPSLRGRKPLLAAEDWWRKGFFDPEFYSPADPAHLAHAPREARFAARALRLRQGTALLDLCCGPGRHALLFARRGARVTGVDYSIPYLLEGRRRARRAGQTVRFLRGDMRALAFDTEFDAAVNLYTSFGYFSRQADDLRVLRGVRRALKPGGLFLLDFMHRDWLLSHFSTRDWHAQDDGWLLEERELDAAKRMVTTRRIRLFSDGRELRRDFRVRLYGRREISVLLRRAGLRPLRFWGDFRGSPLSKDTNRLIVLSQRP
ncbi:MAG: hypothetical protein A2X36_13335 [Elusimicrobia bacterium GWA2_69_24]|nr:MAG: hypothetical protein A2X36_13335 [Elusimicrobia bacterium GWA2_69_24]